MPPWTRFARFAFAAYAAAVYADDPIGTGMAVVDFELPLFNEDDQRSWSLRGDKGIYESEHQIRIQGMRVTQYSGDAEAKRIAILTSPDALFNVESTTANGPGELRVKTREFEIKGSDWVWRGDQKEITLNRSVKVVFFESVGDILK